MRKDGYVTAAEVSRATGRDLSSLHADIGRGDAPGGRFGWGWYVLIDAYVDKLEREGRYPRGSVAMRNLRALRSEVARERRYSARS